MVIRVDMLVSIIIAGDCCRDRCSNHKDNDKVGNHIYISF